MFPETRITTDANGALTILVAHPDLRAARYGARCRQLGRPVRYHRDHQTGAVTVQADGCEPITYRPAVVVGVAQPPTEVFH